VVGVVILFDFFRLLWLGVALAVLLIATVVLGFRDGTSNRLRYGTLGLLIAFFELTPFVVTLAGMFFASGLTVYLTKGSTLGPLPFWLDNLVFRKVLGIPVAAIITVALGQHAVEWIDDE